MHKTENYINFGIYNTNLNAITIDFLSTLENYEPKLHVNYLWNYILTFSLVGFIIFIIITWVIYYKTKFTYINHMKLNILGFLIF